MPLRNLPIKTGHLFLGLAAIMFIVTVMVFSGGKPQPKVVEAKISTEKVVVPLVPVSEGKTLTMNDVTSVKWPSEYLPKGATFADPYDVVGRVAKQDLFPGEPIFKEKVTGTDTNGGLPAIIPPGLRAVSVAVTEVKGVAGFVKPGDRVDVLTTFEVDQDKGEQKVRMTRTVLQNVLVLASAQTMVDENKYNMETPSGVARGETSATAATTDKASQDAASKAEEERKAAREKEKDNADADKSAKLVSSVTFALTPEQTEKLALAEETGEIRLSLRPETDHSIAKVEGVDFDQLLGKPQRRHAGTLPPAPRMPSAPPMMAPSPAVLGTQVEFIQGSDKTIYNFN